MTGRKNKINNMIEKLIKKYIKEHLKIKVEYATPHSLCDGKIKASIYLDDELVDSSEQKIMMTFF